MSESESVIITAVEGTKLLGARAFLHYCDDAGPPNCGSQAPRGAILRTAAQVLAALIEGAAPCPECQTMHHLEAEMVKAPTPAAPAADPAAHKTTCRVCRRVVNLAPMTAEGHTFFVVAQHPSDPTAPDAWCIGSDDIVHAHEVLR